MKGVSNFITYSITILLGFVIVLSFSLLIYGYYDQVSKSNIESSLKQVCIQTVISIIDLYNKGKESGFTPEKVNVVVSWGSPKGAILEAMEILRGEGTDFKFVQVRMPHPLPEERITKILKKADTSISIEMNFSGQLADVIRERTGLRMDYRVVKYNGRPMTTTEVLSALRKVVQGEAPVRQVLTYGS